MGASEALLSVWAVEALASCGTEQPGEQVERPAIVALIDDDSTALDRRHATARLPVPSRSA